MRANLVELFRAVKPCVAAVTTDNPLEFEPLKVVGTAFCVDPAGILVTARHVIAKAEQLAPAGAPPVVMFTRPVSPERPGPLLHIRGPMASWQAVDDLDIAVARISLSKPWPALSVSAGEHITEGTWVAACGFPLGLVYGKPEKADDLMNSMSSIFQTGIVASVVPHPASALPRRRYVLDMDLNEGNSGGPVFSEAGTVVAVVARMTTVEIARPDGFGFYFERPAGLTDALPITRRVLEVIEEVRREQLNESSTTTPGSPA